MTKSGARLPPRVRLPTRKVFILECADLSALSLTKRQSGDKSPHSKSRPKTPSWLEFQRGFNESAEQRMRFAGLRLKLRVKLAGDEPRVITQFDQLNQIVLAVYTGNVQP